MMCFLIAKAMRPSPPGRRRMAVFAEAPPLPPADESSPAGCLGVRISSREGRLVDALASRGDEGRGTLRKATGSREQALIRGYPNGETRPARAIAH